MSIEIVGTSNLGGVEAIALERQRQISKENYTPDDDVFNNKNGELALAAICYAAPNGPTDFKGWLQHLWPWDRTLYKPSPLDRKRELAKAAALLAAEYDRISIEESQGIAQDIPAVFPKETPNRTARYRHIHVENIGKLNIWKCRDCGHEEPNVGEMDAQVHKLQYDLSKEKEARKEAQAKAKILADCLTDMLEVWSLDTDLADQVKEALSVCSSEGGD